jgi:hypothetical protein
LQFEVNNQQRLKKEDENGKTGRIARKYQLEAKERPFQHEVIEEWIIKKNDGPY